MNPAAQTCKASRLERQMSNQLMRHMHTLLHVPTRMEVPLTPGVTAAGSSAEAGEPRAACSKWNICRKHMEPVLLLLALPPLCCCSSS